MSILSRLFQRWPRHQVSGYRTIYNALVAQLTRQGVTIGKTAKYPRVEIHSIREQERLDKDGALRQISVTVESISNRSLGEATTMNEDNLRLLTENELELTGWTCLGILPAQLQDMTESSDTNKIIYRLLQSFYIFIEKVKSDTPPPDPEETPAETPEPDETQDTTIETINN